MRKNYSLPVLLVSISALSACTTTTVPEHGLQNAPACSLPCDQKVSEDLEAWPLEVIGIDELDKLLKRDAEESRKLRRCFNANIDYARANCSLMGATQRRQGKKNSQEQDKSPK